MTTTTTDHKTNVHALIDKAAKAEDSADAMRYSQAALNAANALLGLGNLKADRASGDC